jgi:hypothetical protein
MKTDSTEGTRDPFTTGDPTLSGLAAQKPSVFLERRSYRRRRLMDAAKLLPMLGAMLLAIPMLWPTGAEGESPPTSTSSAIIYIFLIWTLLILVNVVFSLGVRRWAESWVSSPADTAQDPR